VLVYLYRKVHLLNGVLDLILFIDSMKIIIISGAGAVGTTEIIKAVMVGIGW
jgi:hypothetical protein